MLLNINKAENNSKCCQADSHSVNLSARWQRCRRCVFAAVPCGGRAQPAGRAAHVPVLLQAKPAAAP